MTGQRQYRNQASFGKRQEFIAVAELLRRRFDVYMPLVDDQQIDCIIRRGDHDYVDVQIKARSRDCRVEDAGRFAAMNVPCPREKYFFLFYSEHIDTYWVFPSCEFVEKASRNRSGKNEGKYTIHLTGLKRGEVYALERFGEYKNKFELLRT